MVCHAYVHANLQVNDVRDGGVLVNCHPNSPPKEEKRTARVVDDKARGLATAAIVMSGTSLLAIMIVMIRQVTSFVW